MLDPDVCLVPGVPMVRVERAPGNARRIFTGIDIVADCEDVLEVVWGVLNDYPRLGDAVPNLVDNKVVKRLEGGGARLRQVRSEQAKHSRAERGHNMCECHISSESCHVGHLPCSMPFGYHFAPSAGRLAHWSRPGRPIPRRKQVGAAQLAPMFTFRAMTTLDAVPYPSGIPPSMEAEHLDRSTELYVARTVTLRLFAASIRLAQLTWPLGISVA